MEPIKEQDPKQLGDWRIMGRLGEGGFGTVFLAERGAQKAAIKVIRDDPDALLVGVERFQLEIAALKRLVDPYIARIVDSNLEGEVPWFATEFVNGPTLEAKVKYEGVLEERNWFNLAANLFHALNTSHSAGVVHKDIKPSNIILGETGNKLIDFGIAHVSGQTRKVNFGDFEGSRPYSSPESSTGNSVPGMDVFSAAVTLAYAGLGRSIWKGENEVQLMRSINESEPDLEGLTHIQTNFLKPLLNKNVSDRPSAEDAYRTSLRILATLDTGTEKINLRGWERAAKSTKPRNLSRSTSILASVLVLVGGFGTYKLLNSGANANRLSTLVTTVTSPSPTSSLGDGDVGDKSPTSKEIQANLDLAKKYFEQKNYEKAMVYARLAANSGNAHGMYDVAYILVAQGKKTEAISWYEKAANLGYGDAFWNLGALYMSLGKTDLALNWYEKGGKQNNIGSLNALGYYFGEKVRNYKKAIPYYQKSANLGDVMAMANLGFAYDELNDIASAKKWYRKASDLGNIDASLNLGYLYEKEADWVNARKYYQRAADKKDPTSMYNLALVLGNHFGQGDKGCILLNDALNITSIEPDIKKLVEVALKDGCSNTPTATPNTNTNTNRPASPVPSYVGTTYSEQLADNLESSSIFGRAYLYNSNWNIPLTNNENETPPPINRVQFKDASKKYASWWNVPYKLEKTSINTWNAVVYNIGIQLMFGDLSGKTICPEIRFALVENNQVVYIWNKSVETCTNA